MIPEAGHFALILALLAAAVQGSVPLVGAARGRPEWMALARPAAQVHFALVALAFACLAASFVTSDFSVLNVATNSNSRLPLAYRVAATWGSHEGSLLLWVLMLALWTLGVTLFSRGLPREMAARVIGVMGLVSVGFILFLLLTSNPFRRLLPAAAEGRDLNPLLQDPGMVLHPPMLYMGYVGFSVAFAFAVAALLAGRLDAAWARWSRPWTTAAWSFLTVGIALGSWWAYYELGWGGWWFWDPVENASFMPWLAGTALIHSLAVTEKRGAFRGWTALLAICAFALSLLGAFLVRSGVLTSVHTFATDPKRGLFLLALFAVVVGGALALFAWRTARIGLGGRFEPVSRESLLLVNNLLLAVATGVVLLGTLYPLVLDALGLGKVSVGPPYFDAVFVPIMAPLVFLMGVGPLARWKLTRMAELAAGLRGALVAATLAAAAAPFAMGEWRLPAFLGLFLSFWVLCASALSLMRRLHGAGGARAGLRAQPRSYYGMLAAHCGVAALVAGVTLVSSYETQRHAAVAVGDSLAAGGHEFRFDGAVEITGPNYSGMRGRVEVTRDGQRVATLHPEKRLYASQPMPMTEAAIHSGLRGDLYVALDEPVGAGAWGLRVHTKPFVTWIWGGAFLMALGGLLAVSDRRYRVVQARGADAANLAVLRAHRLELEADLASGLLPRAKYQEARLEIDGRALAETAGEAAPPPGAPHRRRGWVAACAGLALPALAVALYLHLGSPEALRPSPAASAGSASREQVEALAMQLAARLEREPDDARGWAVLALSYYSLKKFPEAARAYGRLGELVPANAQVLADHADALAMASGRRVTGAPLELARRALELDPAQWKALALVAGEAFAREDYAAAIAYWERLRAVAPPDSPVARAVAGYLAQARQLAAVSAAERSGAPGPAALPR